MDRSVAVALQWKTQADASGRNVTWKVLQIVYCIKEGKFEPSDYMEYRKDHRRLPSEDIVSVAMRTMKATVKNNPGIETRRTGLPCS